MLPLAGVPFRLPPGCEQKDVFLFIPHGAPPPESSFPVLRYSSSQNESQWKDRFFQGKFQLYPQGCDWPRALLPKKRPNLWSGTHFPSPQLTSLPTSCPNTGDSKVSMSLGSPHLSTTAPNTFDKEKHKPQRKHKAHRKARLHS